jgi:hypothetical protein
VESRALTNNTARGTFDTRAETEADRHAKCWPQLSGFKHDMNIDNAQKPPEKTDFMKFVQKKKKKNTQTVAIRCK